MKKSLQEIVWRTCGRGIGGDQYGDNRVHRSADGKHLYVDAGQGNLIIDGNIVIQNYGTGGTFGLTMNGAAADTAPALTITGDLAPIDQDAAAAGVQLGYDSRNNLITDPNTPEPGRADWLYGGTGNDVITGKGGGDILYGASGDDRLYANTQMDVAIAIAQGNAQAGTGLKGDWLAGGDGSDILVGSTGNDVLSGGSGSDLLIGGAGDDDILGDSDYVATSFDWTVTDANGERIFSPVIDLSATGTADVIYAGRGDDNAWGGLGNDILFGEGGNDYLDGGDGNDVLIGGPASLGQGTDNDTLFGGAGSDYLDGGDGADQLQGGAGDDILIGGAGIDTLYGGEGKDTYIFNRGDGRDTVIDTKADNNIFRFGAGISASDITLRLGSLMLDLGNSDQIHIGNFDQNDVFNSSSITGFEFADGSTLTTTELLARGFDLDGTAGDDQIVGTNDAPVTVADVTTAQEDVTIIATGNVLANDTDVDQGTVLGVANAGVFAGSYGSLTLVADGSYSYALDNASLSVQSLAAGQIVTETFAYAATDGIVATPSTLTVSITGTNDAPVVVADTAAVQEDLTLIATGNVLANDRDVDQGAVLSVANAGVFAGSYGSLTLAADGSYSYALDNASLAVQSLAAGQIVTETFAYAATDGIVATPSTLTVNITGTNDAPVVVADIASVQEDLTLIATGNVLANDTDVDQGTVLSVANAGVFAGNYGSLTLAADGSYSYALDNASLAVQSLGRDAQVVEHFSYTATDGMVGTASTLDIFVNGTNDAPILVAPLADQTLERGKHFSWQMPTGSFTDIDQGDTLAYTASQADGSALPEWLKFDAVTRTFSGEAPKECGSVDILMTATDQVAATGSTAGSLSASDVFHISVSKKKEEQGKGSQSGNHSSNTGNAQHHAAAQAAHDHSDSGSQSAEHKAQDRSNNEHDSQTQDAESRRTEAQIRAWFDEQSTSERYSPFDTAGLHGNWGSLIDRQVNRNVERGLPGDFSSEWERMNAQLKQHLEKTGRGDSTVSEFTHQTRPLDLFASSGYGNAAQLSMDSRQQMTELSGLKEGLARLAA